MKRIYTGIFLIVLFFFFASLRDSFAQVQRNHLHANCICLPVAIANQPVSPSAVCQGSGTASFTVDVSGTGPLTYRWKENSVALNDGGSYSGTHTATLTITNPSAGLNGKIYQCIITNCSGFSVCTNSSAILTVQLLPGDINADGVVDNTDFSLLNLIYNSLCPNCPEDLIPDGFIDVKDFLELLGQYNMSCQ